MFEGKPGILSRKDPIQCNNMEYTYILINTRFPPHKCLELFVLEPRDSPEVIVIWMDLLLIDEQRGAPKGLTL